MVEKITHYARQISEAFGMITLKVAEASRPLTLTAELASNATSYAEKIASSTAEIVHHRGFQLLTVVICCKTHTEKGVSMNLSQAVNSLSEDKYIQTMFKKEMGIITREIALMEAQSFPVESITLKLKEALGLLEGEVVHSKSARKKSD